MGQFTFVVLLILAFSQTGYGCGGGGVQLGNCGGVRQVYQMPTVPQAQPTYYYYYPSATYYPSTAYSLQPGRIYTPAQRAKANFFRPITYAQRFPTNMQSQTSMGLPPIKLPPDDPSVEKIAGFQFLYGNGEAVYYRGADRWYHLVAIGSKTGRTKTFVVRQDPKTKKNKLVAVSLPDQGNALALQRELAIYYQLPEVKEELEGERARLAQSNVNYWYKTYQDDRETYPTLKPIRRPEIALASRLYNGTNNDDSLMPQSQPQLVTHAGSATGPTRRGASSIPDGFFNPARRRSTSPTTGSPRRQHTA